MDIVIITDTPVVKGQSTISPSMIASMSTNVYVVFAEDFIHDRMRGYRADLVMIPKTIKEVDEVHAEVISLAKVMVNTRAGEVMYY